MSNETKAPQPPAEAQAQGQAVDREADRARFSDAAFNAWLDTGISDAGHTVWDAVGDTQAAWAGWEARQFAGDAVLISECCGREECGGECGNEWRGMGMYRKPADAAPPSAPEAQGGGEVVACHCHTERDKELCLRKRDCTAVAAHSTLAPPSAPAGVAERTARALLTARANIGACRPDDEDEDDQAWWDELTDLAALAQQPAAPHLHSGEWPEGSPRSVEAAKAYIRDWCPDYVKDYIDALAQQPAAVDEAWKPISEAPTGKLCIVGWQVVEAGEYPDRHEFDYIEDGRWVHHDENVDHAAAVAPSGSKLPSVEPPYQWFIEVPDFPALAAQQGGSDNDR